MEQLSNQKKEECLDLLEENKNTDDMHKGQVRPWIRYFARYFDILLFGFVMGIILEIFSPSLTEKIDNKILGMLILFFWIIFEALLLSTCKTTPGKFLFKINIRDKNLNKLSFHAAFSRSVSVWFAGMGIGFPFATLITLIISYNRLKKDGITKWDSNGEFIVLHGKLGVVRVLIAIVLFTAFLLLQIYGVVS